uniref:Uncharacterized protein n=1 Tax=Acrobeloides nanus TaxID=290746 RepID=A0A914C121_9BILA
MAEPKILDETDTESLIPTENQDDPEMPSNNKNLLTFKEVVCSSTFKLFFVILILNDTWCQITSGLFKAYGMQFIRDDFFLAAISSLASVTNCLTRVVWGISADRTSFQSTLVVCNTIGASFMCTLGVIKLSGSAYLYLIWICIMFSCIGGTYTLIPYALHKCFGGKNFGFANGALQLSLVNKRFVF